MKLIFVVACAFIQSLAFGFEAVSLADTPQPRSGNLQLSFDDFQQRPLPKGFVRWCGTNGRLLMGESKKTGGVFDYWVQGPSVEDKFPIGEIHGVVNCDQTGNYVIVSTTDNGNLDGRITKLSVHEPISVDIVTYHRNASENLPKFADNSAMVSISPNMRYVAFDSVTFDKNSFDAVRLLAVGHSQAGRQFSSIQWSRDSTFLLNSMIVREEYENQKLHQEAVQVINVESGKTVIGELPQGAWFEKGAVLPGGNKLLIFARPSSKDVGRDPGSIYSYGVTSIVTCRLVLSNVDDLSFSDDGEFASVKELYKDPKHRVDGDADVLPIGYVAEIRNADGALIVSQRFVRKEHDLDFNLTLAPNGREVALLGGGKSAIVNLDARK